MRDIIIKTMTTLERLLERADMVDMRLNRSGNDFASLPLVFVSVRYRNTPLHSYLSSQSSVMFTFSIPWNMLCKEDLIEEKLIDFNNGHDSISLKECSEAFQNEVLKRMISAKKPDETLFVEKYTDDDKWNTKTVIPSVLCLEELEIMLDLENGESHG